MDLVQHHHTVLLLAQAASHENFQHSDREQDFLQIHLLVEFGHARLNYSRLCGIHFATTLAAEEKAPDLYGY